MKTLSRLIHWCLDLVFPKHCLGCGREGLYLCPDCYGSLGILPGASCYLCGKRSPDEQICDACRRKHPTALSGLLVAADWSDLLLRQIIYEFKYRFVKELADPLSGLMTDFFKTSQLINRPTDELILIPVPLHGRRLAWRGFNQATVLARKISSRLEIAMRDDILIRSRHTLPQRAIADRQARSANIQNAFTLSKNYFSPPSLRAWTLPAGKQAIPRDAAKNPNPLKNKIIILVDDVATTASTLEDCARALEPLAPKEIWGLVVARG